MENKYSDFFLNSNINKENIRYNEPMSKHTTIKIGGIADVLVTPSTLGEVSECLKIAKENDIPVTVIGNGSKLLVKDKGIRGLVIKIAEKLSNYEVNENYVTVEAGMSVPRFSYITRDLGLSGFEFAAGIPAKIGGAVYMNAGAYGSEISEVFVEAMYINKDLKIKKITKEEMNFGYRKTFFNSTEDINIILSAKFKLETLDKETISKKIKENNDSRRSKQPLEYPSAGSTFKRPEGHFVGKLIDDAGLRGKRIGGAEISTKHSGFIVNIDNATAKDVIDLIEYTKKEVFEKFNVKLVEEIRIIGE